MDYRALPTPGVSYDKAVSIEMLEAVGKEYLETYCTSLLYIDSSRKTELQFSSVSRCQKEDMKDMRKARISFESTSSLVDISHPSANLWRTSAKDHKAPWLSSELRIESRIRPALMIEHEDLGDKEVEVFRRKWEVCNFASAPEESPN